MSNPERNVFRVALTADFFDIDGNLKFKDVGLELFADCPRVESCVLGENRPELGSDQLGGIQGVILGGERVSVETVSAAENLLAFSRVGVGYDAVDVSASTEADVVVLIAAGGVNRSMGEATVGLMIALTHRLIPKDRLVRAGAWDDRTKYHGVELRDRTFGAVGLGGIARETMRLLSTFGMNKPIAFDPFVDAATAESLGVEKVSLDELMQRADFVSIHCPLTDETSGLVGAQELNLMKPEAYLINTARGGIVDEDALFEHLQQGRIAGAGIDCFVGEPIVEPHRFGALNNVILAPHSIGWTEELFRDIGRMACQSLVDLALGRVPPGVVNKEVFERHGFQQKWKRLQVKG